MIFDTENSANQLTASEAAEAGFIQLITSALMSKGSICQRGHKVALMVVADYSSCRYNLTN